MLSVNLYIFPFSAQKAPDSAGLRHLSSHDPDSTTYTYLRFSRYHDTCDPDDIGIAEATTRLVYAMADSIPADSTNSQTMNIPYHTHRGSTSLRLRDGGSDPVMSMGVKPPDTPLLVKNFTVNEHTVPSYEEGSDISGNLFGAGLTQEEAEALPRDTTSYWCKSFDMSDFAEGPKQVSAGCGF